MRLKELHEKFRDRVEFIVVYVKEAHASDRWWLGRSRTQKSAATESSAEVSPSGSFSQMRLAGRTSSMGQTVS